MFSSPAPRATPRRGGSRAPTSLSRGTPSIFSERDRQERASEYPVTPSARSTRHTQARRASPASSAGETTRTARQELDNYEKVYWSRDARKSVASAGPLPVEVARLVKSSDPGRGPVTGSVDAQSGFALVANSDTVIAWNYAKRAHSSPTCYTFPAPRLSQEHTRDRSPVLAALLSGNKTGEPGLVMVGASGEIRLWDSVSLALANVERYQRAQLELENDDYVQGLWQLSPTSFLIATSTSMAFRLVVTSSAGRLVPTVVPFTKSSGIFGRATPAIFGAKDDRYGLTAVSAHGDVGYLLASKTLQRWTLAADGQKFQQDYPIQDVIHEALASEGRASSGAEVEVKDVVALGPDNIAVLSSLFEQQSGSAQAAQERLAIVLLSIAPRSGHLSTERVITLVSHIPTGGRPRLNIPAGSPLALVTLSTAIVVASLTPEVPYDDVITLKDPKNLIFGAVQKSGSPKHGVSPALFALTATGGILSVEISEDAGSALLPNQTPTARLRSSLEQAVYFGTRPENPLSFDTEIVDGNVAEAALAVSAQLLSSSSPYLPSIFELRPQLLDRSTRHRALVHYICRNHLLSRLPQTVRRALSEDAEKLRAASDLWDHQNRLMDNPASALLSDAITTYMSRQILNEDADAVRSFFRSHLKNLEQVLEIAYDLYRSSRSSDSKSDLGPWVAEINNIFIIVNRAASVYREDERQTYEIDRERPASELWTAADGLIDDLDNLYSATALMIKDRTRDLGSAVDEWPSQSVPPAFRQQQELQGRLKRQLVDLAAALCTNMEDKMRAAKTELDLGADPSQGASLADRWASLKPRVIRPLVDIDRIAEAYELAEHHSDYSTLVFLCHHPLAGAKSQVRLQTYIERFGEPFAFVLYEYYIEHGRLYELMNQDEVYGHLLTRFFAEYGYPELSWMHDIACKRYGEAASALVFTHVPNQDLARKQLVSSIGKLASVAEIKVNGESAERAELLESIDDELDLLKVQEALQAAIRAAATHRKGKLSLSAFADQHLQNLGDRPTLKSLFIELAQHLLEGRALDVEGFVDVLTLKVNRGDWAADPASALDRLVKDADLPEGRKQVALLSTWRRVFIQDNWTEIARTQGRSEQAQRHMLRATLTYATLKILHSMPDFPRAFVLSPITSIQPPLLAELSARFPDWPSQDLQALMQDHEDEIRVLNEYITEAGLEERVLEVTELVRSDEAQAAGAGAGAGEGADGDVDM